MIDDELTPDDDHTSPEDDEIPSGMEWAFRTSNAIHIERRRLEDEPELAPGSAIVGSFKDGRMFARCAAPEDWTPEHDHGLFDAPRVIHYSAEETEGGAIRAEICAIIPPADIPREPWQPEPDEDAPIALVLLGVVVRLAHERTGGDFAAECLDHFLRIISDGADTIVDRLLKSV